MPRGRLPTRLARCIRCDLTDQSQLFAVTLQRAYRPRRPDGSRPRQRMMSFAMRLCRRCAAEMLRERERSLVATAGSNAGGWTPTLTAD